MAAKKLYEVSEKEAYSETHLNTGELFRDDGDVLFKSGNTFHFINGKAVAFAANFFDSLDPVYYRALRDLIGRDDYAPIETLDQIPKKIPYQYSMYRRTKLGLHIGQLKLFLTELQFMTKVLTGVDIMKPVFIYAGSSPSNPLPFLLDMFEACGAKYVCCDPNEHGFMYVDDASNNARGDNMGRSTRGMIHYRSTRGQKEVVYLVATSGNRHRVIGPRVINLYNVATDKIERYDKAQDEARVLEISAANIKALNEKSAPIFDFVTKKFALSDTFRILVIEDIFTHALAQFFAGLNWYFLSDIRTNINDASIRKALVALNGQEKVDAVFKNIAEATEGNNEADDGSPGDIDIVWNLAQQYNWINIMRPPMSMLKFRHIFYEKTPTATVMLSKLEPFATELALAAKSGLHMIDNYVAKKFQYLVPEQIYIQSFPGQMSTETRLYFKAPIAPSTPLPIIFMSTNDFEDRFMWYNAAFRSVACCTHGGGNEYLGIDYCVDCRLAIHIFCEYYKKIGGLKMEDSALQLRAGQDLARIMHSISRRFFQDGSIHGFMYKKINTQSGLDILINNIMMTQVIKYYFQY